MRRLLPVLLVLAISLGGCIKSATGTDTSPASGGAAPQAGGPEAYGSGAPATSGGASAAAPQRVVDKSYAFSGSAPAPDTFNVPPGHARLTINLSAEGPLAGQATVTLVDPQGKEAGSAALGPGADPALPASGRIEAGAAAGTWSLRFAGTAVGNVRAVGTAA